MSKDNNSGKLKRYFKYNMARIFLVGLLIGTVFMAVHVVTRSLDSQKFEIKYNAYIYASYNLLEGEKDITSKDCFDAISSGEYKTQMEAYLGSYVTYDEFLDNLRFDVEEGKITTYYTDDSQVRAKRIVNTVSGKLCDYFSKSNKVGYIIKNGKTIAEEVKVMGEPTIKLGITYFTEIGLVVGWIIGVIIFLIIYYGNGRIKKKVDIEDELHVLVLAEVPYIEEL
ncbi:MAG: hypothetical protein E7262_05325 [Lachnospiraceae bacterium]|nr:hypothetical protein [Lachnospiraceae bacterium]